MEPLKVKIGERDFLLMPITGRAGLKVGHKLVRLLAPIIVNFTEGVKGKKLGIKDVMEMDFDTGVLVKAIESIADGLEGKDAEHVIDTVMKHSRIYITEEEAPEAKYEHFTGKYKDLYVLVFEHIKYQFSDFFGDGTSGENS